MRGSVLSEKIKNTLIISGTVVIMTLIIILIMKLVFDKVKLSEDGTVGNTPGNLFNMGLFCEKDGIIYFSNVNDYGRIYSMDPAMSDYSLVSTDTGRYLNVDENYVYYSRMNNLNPEYRNSLFAFMKTGLCACDLDGNNNRFISNDSCGMLSLNNNVIYYQRYREEEGVKLVSVGIDGSDEKIITDETILPGAIRNNTLYYTGVRSDHGIHTIDLFSLNERTLFDGFTYMPIPASNGIYYISTQEGYNICRIDYSGQEKVTVVDEFCSFFNLSNDGRYLFYQVDGGNNNRICYMDLSTGVSTTILDGNYKWLNVTDDYLFFYTMEEDMVYAFSTNGSGILNIFNPPDLTRE